MIPSGSTAVMARRVEPHDSLDWFPTPLWATRALCEYVAPIGAHLAWDPACGDGAMVRALGDYALAVAGSDVHDYGCGFTVHDFLQPYTPDGIAETEWIVTNPPFRLAEQFVHRGLQTATHGVAILVRTAFIEGQGRYERLFRDTPPVVIAQFAERVPMVKGRLDPEVSTATSYCWLVWQITPAPQTRLVWIPPCRAQLERPGDWPDLSRETSPIAPDALFDGATP